MRNPNSPSAKRRYSTLQALAQERDGELLSEYYRGVHTKLHWRCKKGHEWYASPRNVKNLGHWCPVCGHENSRAKRRHSIETLQAAAAKHGGRLLSSTYTNVDDVLHWQCRHGHTWSSRVMRVLNGHWCPQCAGQLSPDDTLSCLSNVAQSRGGVLLSTTYESATTPLHWRCKKGHEWQDLPINVKKGHWCPECNGRKPYELEEQPSLHQINLIARHYGGECHTFKYAEEKNTAHVCLNESFWKLGSGGAYAINWCLECPRQLNSTCGLR